MNDIVQLYIADVFYNELGQNFVTVHLIMIRL